MEKKLSRMFPKEKEGSPRNAMDDVDKDRRKHAHDSEGGCAVEKSCRAPEGVEGFIGIEYRGELVVEDVDLQSMAAKSCELCFERMILPEKDQSDEGKAAQKGGEGLNAQHEESGHGDQI